jgi:hypothetical protein
MHGFAQVTRDFGGREAEAVLRKVRNATDNW